MQKFILKKIFDVRPLNKKGELNLHWVLKQGGTVKLERKIPRIRPEFIEESFASVQHNEKTSSSQNSESFSINYPAWEEKQHSKIKIAPAVDYEYEEIRNAIMRELEEIDFKETCLKQEFGPPLNLPLEIESKKEKKAHFWLKKFSPQVVNLKIKLPQIAFPKLAPSLRYILATILFLAIAIPVANIIYRAPKTKDFVLTSGNQGYQDLLSAQKSLLNFNPIAAAANFQEAYKNFNQASQAVNSLGGSLINIVDIFPLRYKIGAGKKLLEAGKSISKAGTYLAKGLEILSNIKINNILAPPQDTVADAEKPTFYLKSFRQQFDLAKDELTKGIDNIKNIKAKDLPENYRAQFASLSQVVPQLETNINKFDGYFDTFLKILGNETPRHYLILFQNNAELRATGGFIGSYALIEIFQGQVDKMEVKNIFDADGQLIVNIIPPQPIQKISSGWSTHDANWFFDFPTSAEKIAWFFEKTGGPTIDGIIALTPTVIEKILTVLGPISLPEYNLAITQDNFVNEIQYKVEKDYDPYQNQPKKILGDFTAKLIEKIATTNASDWPKLVTVLDDTLKTKDLILWLKDANEEKFIQDQNWSGKITDTKGDYLAIVHSNINGYKTDRFMKDDIGLDLEVEQNGNIIHHLTITRRHTGGKEPYDWYNKVNADYLRIYLPKNSKIVETKGNTPEIILPPLDYGKANFKPDPLVASIESTLVHNPSSNLDIFQESGKTVVGAWLYTSPGEETVFEIKYETPGLVLISDNNTDQKTNYNLVFQKQPGSYNAPLRLTITYPGTWRIAQVYPRETLISQTPLRFREALDIDKMFSVDFNIK